MTRRTLGQISHIITGFPFKSEEFSETGIQLLRGDNIAPGRLRWNGVVRWQGVAPDIYHLRKGDVVLAMDRPWIGAGLKVASVRGKDLPALLVQRVAAFRAGPGVDQRFLEMSLKDPRFASFIQGVQTGTAVPHISSKQIASYELVLPPEANQIAIAAVLGALDDKIAANAAVAGTVDELAKAMFERDSANCPLGHSYQELADVGGGGTPSTKQPEFWGDQVPWATPTDVTRLEAPYLCSTSRRLTHEGLTACSSPLYPAGSILMTSRATIGAFALAEKPMAVNQGFIVVRPRDPDSAMWLFHEMRSRVSEYKALANGATFLELSRGRFKAMPVRVGTPEEMSRFGDRVRPLHESARHSMSENRTLVELRDTLLPALMSGRLKVKDAERQVEDAV